MLLTTEQILKEPHHTEQKVLLFKIHESKNVCLHFTQTDICLWCKASAKLFGHNDVEKVNFCFVCWGTFKICSLV